MASSSNLSAVILNGVTLGGHPVYDPPEGGIPTNVFTMHTGGSRYGYGRFLMTLSDYTALQKSIATGSSGTGDGTGSTTLTMQTGPTPRNGSSGSLGPNINCVSFKVVLAGYAPYSSGITGITDMVGSTPAGENMVEAIVFDMRVWATKPVTQSFNVQYQGFPYDVHGKEIFYHSTLNTNVPYSWSDVINKLELNLSDPNGTNLFSSITWNPHNLIYDAIATNKMYDDIAGQLYLVVCFDYTKTFGDATNSFLQFAAPGITSNWNNTVQNAAQNYTLAGGFWNRNPTRMPNAVAVNFKGYNRDNPGDPYVSGERKFTVTVPTNTITNGQIAGTTDSSYVVPIWVGGYIAVYEGGAIVNGCGLTTVANNMAAYAIAAWTTPFYEAEYAGIWAFKPDGAIRSIQWSSNQRGAFTRIRLNNDKAFNPADETKYTIDFISNQLNIGLGGMNTSPSPQGTRFIWRTDTCFLGVIASSGSMGQSDFSDSRYWVQLALVTNSDGSTNSALTFGSQSWMLSSMSSSMSSSCSFPSSGSATTVVVTNLGEYVNKAHTLPVGTPILAFPVNDASGITRLVAMVGGFSQLVAVSLTTDGGTNGTAIPLTFSSLTYTAVDTTTGKMVGMMLQELLPRFHAGPCNPAVWGIGAKSDLGAVGSDSPPFTLFYAHETYSVVVCGST